MSNEAKQNWETVMNKPNSLYSLQRITGYTSVYLVLLVTQHAYTLARHKKYNHCSFMWLACLWRNRDSYTLQ